MFEIRPLVLREEDDGSIVCIERPLVTLVTERSRFRLHTLNPRLTLEGLGYRLVSQRPWFPAAVYARPWLVWAPLRGVEMWKRGYWAMVRWLFDRGIFHLSTAEGAAFRWRDIRLGSQRGADG